MARNTGGDFEAAFLNNLQVVKELGDFSGIMNEEAQRFVYDFSSKAVPEYVEYLKSAIPARRSNGAKLLRRLGSVARDALDPLKEVAKRDDDNQVRAEAQAAVAEIERQLSSEKETTAVLRPLAKGACKKEGRSTAQIAINKMKEKVK
ncbi:HEAT repeat domain-containing protein [Bradyrhizobium sp. AZCC 2230]|uniref:HEAT repeat domain-containing protein n=1 Tax=Bradyrhizobium sp. AZCC 2230 TaxID=3117021 RepID=UPI002FF2F1E9